VVKGESQNSPGLLPSTAEHGIGPRSRAAVAYPRKRRPGLVRDVRPRPPASEAVRRCDPPPVPEQATRLQLFTSFQLQKNLDDITISKFRASSARWAHQCQFATLAGFHRSSTSGCTSLRRNTRAHGLAAYCPSSSSPEFCAEAALHPPRATRRGLSTATSISCRGGLSPGSARPSAPTAAPNKPSSDRVATVGAVATGYFTQPCSANVFGHGVRPSTSAVATDGMSRCRTNSGSRGGRWQHGETSLTRCWTSRYPCDVS